MTDYGLTYPVGVTCEFCGKPKALHEGPCEAEENYWEGYMLGWNLDQERDDA